MFTACGHLQPKDSLTSEGLLNEQDTRAFTVKATVSQRADSHCLRVQLVDAYGSPKNSGVDNLQFPDICIPSGEHSERVISLSSDEPVPMKQSLPFKPVALPVGTPGVEVRLRVLPISPSTVEYAILYRDSKTKREHRWTGTDALPPRE